MCSLKSESIRAWLLLSLAAALVFPAGAGAAPGTIADTPLFVGSGVKPNIVTLIDDSGSMDWSVLVTNEGQDVQGVSSEGGNYIDPTPSEDPEWRELCAAYNAMAYDPSVTYTPWKGKDANGNEFDDIDVNSAPLHPDTPNTDTVDLVNETCEEGALQNTDTSQCSSSTEGFVYVQWNDADDDDEYDDGECLPSEDGIKKKVKNLTNDQQTNFANWFSYYRKRQFTAQRAFTELAQTAEARMGLATLHDHEDVGTPVVDLTTGTNRETVLDRIASIDSDDGTPLRGRLDWIGHYFNRNDDDTEHDGLGANFNDTSSPILDSGGQCQQNFTMAMTDGFYNGRPDPIDTQDGTLPAHDNTPPGVGNTDGDNNTDFDGGSHADNVNDSLGDIAMHYYERDLASTLDNDVPTEEGVDEQSAQHMVTFGIAFGVEGNLDSMPPNREDSFDGWPEPIKQDSADTIDDLRHAAWNGRGEFLNANDPQGLIRSLRDALSAISERTGSVSGVSFNTVGLTTESMSFVGLFDSSDWSGDLIAFDLDPGGDSILGSEAWRAADELDSMNADNRNIFTMGSNGAVSFESANWSSLPAEAQADLKTGPGGTEQDQQAGEARLDYIRGDRTHEADGTAFDFRDRGSRLGDIINSAPVARNDAVFVGGNDGMLHAFNTEDGQNGGEELFAYIPTPVFSDETQHGLHYLTNPDYSHRFYVDGGPVLTPRRFQDGGRTILVGGLRSGGRGVYALDVTDPANFGTGDVLWEFTSDDDSDLGLTFSQPRIAQVEGGGWVVLFGNGYNNNGSGEAVLYVRDLTDGSEVATLNTEVGTSSDRNGLSSPTLADTDNNGLIDRVYAGDLKGNMWAFEVTDSGSGGGNTNTGDWSFAYESGGSPEELFSTDEPITSAPAIAKNPVVRTTGSTTPNTLVTFGTGQFLTDSDPDTTEQRAFYGVWDHGTGGLTPDNLTAQDFVKETSEVRVLEDMNEINVPYGDTSNNQRHGWKLLFPVQGERVVTSPVIRDDIVFFNTLIPDTDAVCTGGGRGWLMSTTLAAGGQPVDPIFDTNDDQVLDEDDLEDGDPPSGVKIEGTPSAVSFINNKRLVTTPGKGDDDGGQSFGLSEDLVAGSARPLSWEELIRD